MQQRGHNVAMRYDALRCDPSRCICACCFPSDCPKVGAGGSSERLAATARYLHGFQLNGPAFQSSAKQNEKVSPISLDDGSNSRPVGWQPL